jgi:hypothetical protein
MWWANWWLIILVVIVIFILLKFKEIRHKLGFLFVVALVLFLALSFASLYSSHNLDLTSFSGLVKAGDLYVSWLGQAFHNVKSVSSYVIHQDWGLNLTNFTK